MALISLQEIKLSFGGPLIFDDLFLQIERSEKIALLGRNGEGKTTLMKVMAKVQNVDYGDVIYQKGIQVSYLQQDIPTDITGTVFDVVLSGLGSRAKMLSEYHKLTHELQLNPSKDLISRIDKLQNELDQTNSWDLEHQVEDIITRMKLNPEIQFSKLSGGKKRFVLLSKALVSKPDVLLLDEPTNHLDIDSINWLEEFLNEYLGTIFFVTHDRTFMSHLSTRIIELDRGKIYSWACNYNTFLERKEKAIDIENIKWEKFDKKLALEEIWIRKGIKARRCRNEGRVTALLKLREEKKNQRNSIGLIKMPDHNISLPGHLVIKVSHIKQKYDENILIKDFSTQIMRGDKIGIIGNNGSGKTTLINILLKKFDPNYGKVCLGTNLQIAYYDQLREQLNDEKTVIQNISDVSDSIVINGKARHVISYLQDFLFTPDRARTPVKVLSGGERNRLLLARLFTKPFNLLVMDEPTNDLDIETLELLEELLLEYQGTLILVSHDRMFLNNVVTSTIVLDGKGEVNEYAGGYDDWFNYKNNLEKKNEISSKVKINKINTPNKNIPLVRKLTYKEKCELDGIVPQIEKLESEQKEIYKILSDPSFYQKEPNLLIQMKSRLKILEQELKLSYERWEYLIEISKI